MDKRNLEEVVEEYNDALDLDQVAQLLGIGRRRVQELLDGNAGATDGIPYFRRNKKKVVSRRVLAAWMARRMGE